MDTLESQIDVNDPKFHENAAHNRRLAEELRAHVKMARQGGGEKYQQRQREQGKLFVRDRIDQLLDAGSPFLELSPLAAVEMCGSEAPCAGIVAGIGRISVMGGEQAANVLLTVKQEQLARSQQPPLSEHEQAEFKRPILEKYEREGSPYHSTARLWDDGILDPVETSQENEDQVRKRWSAKL